MGEWRECTLGSLLDVKHGFAFLGEYFGEDGSHIVLTPGNFLEKGGFRSKGEKEKWYSGPVPDEYVLRAGDVLVAMTEQAEGLLGSSAKVPTDERYLHNQRLGLVRPASGVDLNFLYHLFNTPTVRQQIRATASGTKVRHTSPSRIAAVKVRVPALAEQHRLAGILSAYDDLIANCERRIKVLDEMARALYREWFVEFRYPGHAGVPLVDSPLGRIPRGWRVQRLGEVLELNYGKALKAEDRSGGPVPVYASSGIVGWHDQKLANGPGVVVGRKGNVGSVFWSDVDYFVIDTAYYVTSALPLRFWYFDLPTKNFINGDAAVPGLSRNQAYALQTLVPDAKLLERFVAVAQSFMQTASILHRQAANLCATRDLLLPRLLSGQLSVSEAA